MWRVAVWDPISRSGRISGPHFDLSVSSAMIDVDDLVVGEEVAVDLEHTLPEPSARRVWPLKARQPKGTSRPEFAELNDAAPADFEVESFSRGVLTIIAGFDLMYSHEFEVVFHAVGWYSGAFNFSHTLFRAASEQEAMALAPDIRGEGMMFCLVTEHGNGPDGPTYIVVAQLAEVRRGTVYHYQRADLKPGERIASWVRSDK